jgi:hypothetical protein
MVADTSGSDMIVYGDEAGAPTRAIFGIGPAVDFRGQTETERAVFQAVRRTNPAVAMTATVTVSDTGTACEYVVQATSST